MVINASFASATSAWKFRSVDFAVWNYLATVEIVAGPRATLPPESPRARYRRNYGKIRW